MTVRREALPKRCANDLRGDNLTPKERLLRAGASPGAMLLAQLLERWGPTAAGPEEEQALAEAAGGEQPTVAVVMERVATSAVTLAFLFDFEACVLRLQEADDAPLTTRQVRPRLPFACSVAQQPPARSFRL